MSTSDSVFVLISDPDEYDAERVVVGVFSLLELAQGAAGVDSRWFKCRFANYDRWWSERGWFEIERHEINVVRVVE